MGPNTLKWYEDNGIPLESTPQEYNEETDQLVSISLPSKTLSFGKLFHSNQGIFDAGYDLHPIDDNDWNDFESWISSFSSESVLPLDEIIKTYTLKTGKLISNYI